MSPRRFFRELAIMACATGGAAIGYSAGVGMETSVQIVLAFLGMALSGAFAEFCLSGRSL